MAPIGFRLGEFIVEPGTDRVLGPGTGERVEIEPKTMAVLLVLAERPGRVVSSDELIRLVWHDRPMGENPVYKSIGKLRRALRDETGEPRYIETISRKGYRLLVEPAALSHEPSPTHDETGNRAVASSPAQAVLQQRRFVGPVAALTVIALAAAIAAFAPGIPQRPTHREAGVAEPLADGTIAHLSQLPIETRQRYLLARAELHERRLGFASRLRKNAEDLIAVAPDFASAHALRAVACTFRAIHARSWPANGSVNGPIDGEEALACARESSRRALEFDPRSAEAHAAAGFLAFHQASDCDPGCDQRGLIDLAQSSLEQAARLDPALPEVHTWLGMIYEQRGDLVRASRQAEAALALDPLNPVATYNANNFLMARGENAKVRERLIPLTSRPDPPPMVFRQLAENALASGNRHEAERWTRELAAHGGQSRGTQLFVATALARLSRIDDARAALAVADQTRAVDTGESLELALWVHQLLDGGSGARTYLADQQGLRASTAHRDTPEEARHWREVEGLGHVLAGEPALAVPLLEKVFGADGMPLVRLQPVDTEADFANALAWAYRETANATRAREVAEGTLVSLDSIASTGFDKSPQLMLDRALALELAGQRDRARAAFEAALARGATQQVELATDPRWQSLVETEGRRFAALPKP